MPSVQMYVLLGLLTFGTVLVFKILDTPDGWPGIDRGPSGNFFPYPVSQDFPWTGFYSDTGF